MLARNSDLAAFFEVRSRRLLDPRSGGTVSDITPLPVYANGSVFLMTDRSANAARLSRVGTAFEKLGVTRLRWHVDELDSPSPDRCRARLTLVHHQADGEMCGSSALTYFLERDPDVQWRLAILEIEQCSGWDLAAELGSTEH